MSREAYTSTVVAPVQAVLAVVLAIAIAVPTAIVGTPGWLPIVVGLVIVVTGLHLSTVRLGVGTARVLIGQGPWGRPARAIAAADVLDASSTTVSWVQAFGIGSPFHRRTTRLTIRPGPALCLTLRGGEYLRVSTPDPDRARQLLPITAHPRSEKEGTS